MRAFLRGFKATVENIGQSADFSFAALIARLSPDLAIIAYIGDNRALNAHDAIIARLSGDYRRDSGNRAIIAI